MNLKVWLFLLLFSVAGCSSESGEQAENGDAVSFANVVEKSEHLEGLFDVYRDKENSNRQANFPAWPGTGGYQSENATVQRRFSAAIHRPLFAYYDATYCFKYYISDHGRHRRFPVGCVCRLGTQLVWQGRQASKQDRRRLPDWRRRRTSTCAQEHLKGA